MHVRVSDWIDGTVSEQSWSTDVDNAFLSSHSKVRCALRYRQIAIRIPDCLVVVSFFMKDGFFYPRLMIGIDGA